MTTLLGDYLVNHVPAFLLLSAALLYFVVMGVRLSIVDIREHRLPNKIVFPSYGIGAVLLAAAAVAAGDWFRLLPMVAGAGILWVAYFTLRVIYPAGMGYGDVKLAGVLGLYLGYCSWGHLLWGSFAAFLLGGLWGVVILLTRRGDRKSDMPFGPFMIVGAAAAMVLLPAIG
ncbi:prepilin peptidase [Arthrobacter roseus]|uniref:prepilin peptidase n=1 Tax=Arthrobacter roseus TaxID=136274 RepID=UPI001966CB55|nr:A24 family peptidase [Arthrobacter roseus]MBM7847985.1 leader peptidase (prepilin peptidase)/N-methyltransferase [Arthrobacter roseus]